MKFCININFTLPKQSQRSRSILQDGSRSLGLFWKEKYPSYNRINTVFFYIYDANWFCQTFQANFTHRSSQKYIF